MRRTAGALALMLIVAGPGAAEGWLPLNGSEIAAILADRSVTYDSAARQRFLPSGRTLYTDGEPTWGSWRIEMDQYCSLWPPSPDWDCYEVWVADPDRITFRDRWGNDFPGTLDPQ